MKSRDNILDISVAVLMLVCFFWAIGVYIFLWFYSGPMENNQVLAETLSPSPLLEVFAFITCIVLSLWLIIGNGVESRLWNWLPPFVFFRQSSKMGRTIGVIVLIIGTLLGLMAELLGFPPAL